MTRRKDVTRSKLRLLPRCVGAAERGQVPQAHQQYNVVYGDKLSWLGVSIMFMLAKEK